MLAALVTEEKIILSFLFIGQTSVVASGVEGLKEDEDEFWQIGCYSTIWNCCCFWLAASGVMVVMGD